MPFAAPFEQASYSGSRLQIGREWAIELATQWLGDFFPLITLARACITVGLAAGYRVPGATQAGVHPGILGDPGYLAIML